jgi:hypothetical protein
MQVPLSCPVLTAGKPVRFLAQSRCSRAPLFLVLSSCCLENSGLFGKRSTTVGISALLLSEEETTLTGGQEDAPIYLGREGVRLCH